MFEGLQAILMLASVCVRCLPSNES